MWKEIVFCQSLSQTGRLQGYARTSAHAMGDRRRASRRTACLGVDCHTLRDALPHSSLQLLCLHPGSPLSSPSLFLRRCCCRTCSASDPLPLCHELPCFRSRRQGYLPVARCVACPVECFSASLAHLNRATPVTPLIRYDLPCKLAALTSSCLHLLSPALAP